ncbi:AfsR/SARP family transcriptional regulator [Microtetraspora niveoalba]|uniref:AfsR/SARP family transcriptional regulator n=1 Tax=Microtetraspora niveoalba TaxID=46175 RepID=UPI000B200764|nr:AfsR/SARP family transcriptional regulator [Microtetraspora niveoalba]
MDFRLLGETAVLAGDGTSLDLGPRKQRMVLGALMLRADETIDIEQLVDVIWPEATNSRVAVSSLHVYVCRLRRILEPGTERRGDYEIIARRSRGYRLTVRQESLDIGRVRILAQEGRKLFAAGHSAQASAYLRKALAEWRGAPLKDFPDGPWIRDEAHYLAELHRSLIEDAAEADLAQGLGPVLVPELGRLLAAFPYRERLRVLTAHALYQAGRQADALSLIAEGRRQMAEAFGLDPDPRIRVMEDRILHHDPSLTPRHVVRLHGGSCARGRRQATTRLTPKVLATSPQRGTLPTTKGALSYVATCFIP